MVDCSTSCAVSHRRGTHVYAMTDERPPDAQLDALNEEIARLRAENEQLRGRYRIPAQPPTDESEPSRPVRVLLLPDPVAPIEPGRPGPEAMANVARVLISHLGRTQPDVDWQAEHDLERIPQDVACFQIGEVLRCVWDGTGPLPKTYRVEAEESGTQRLVRSLIDGDPDSDRFRAGYERQLRIVDELLEEGRAAHDAGAHHHAGWTLKAVDVVLARAALALARFKAGRDDWKSQLQEPRPEYDPRYRVAAEHPPGA